MVYQKAFVTGVPKLNRPELEAACEDFSNIINTYPSCTVFKGTLSSGVEISVVSTAISSNRDWPRSSETCFRKKGQGGGGQEQEEKREKVLFLLLSQAIWRSSSSEELAIPKL